MLEVVREDIAALREDNRTQHLDIVQRLNTINGRVQRHDRELADVQVKVAEIHGIGEEVHEIEKHYITKTQAWTGFTFVVTAFGFVLFWMIEHIIK